MEDNRGDLAEGRVPTLNQPTKESSYEALIGLLADLISQSLPDTVPSRAGREEGNDSPERSTDHKNA